MHVLRIKRGGQYVRVCDPSWRNPADTRFSKIHGGRWNAPGEFGALYLNASIEAALANARRALRLQFGDAITFDDLQPNMLPDLQYFTVKMHEFVDAVSAAGLQALGLPATYPIDCEHGRCRELAAKLYKRDEAGIAARSASIREHEELALFDSHLKLQRKGRRVPFKDWYPGIG